MIAKIIDSKTIHVFDKSQFDWYAIRNCGQIFLDPPCKIIEEKDKVVIKATGNKDSRWLWEYFDLDTDYNEIKKGLLKYEDLKEPIKLGGGIRILRQPFVNTVISFIISANNNIKRFTKTLEQIYKAHETRYNSGEFKITVLEKFTEEDFKSMGCGYRAPYLVKAIRQLKDMDTKELSKLNNEELRKKLIELSGVGPKVAACLMLFCGDFHRLDTVPVDTWIKKALEHIPNNKYAGVAQQYIFYYMQHLRKTMV